MNILVLGAGATGGYFGGRLAEAGARVTFLVRPARASRLRAAGLKVDSPFGDIRIPVAAVTRDEVGAGHDLVLLGCKAYDLDDAIDSLKPAVGPGTCILPVLNGMRHLARLDDAFGRERVLGGLCQIAATLAPDGRVQHLNRVHLFVFGPRAPAQAGVCRALAEVFGRSRTDWRLSGDILQEMWEKWLFIAALAGITCLMRADIGAILAAPGGRDLALDMLTETSAIAAGSGHAPRPEAIERFRSFLTDTDSTLSASMLRDIEAGGAIEADHVVGDLIAEADRAGVPAPLLRLVYCHLKAYEARRAR
jgi:2-dehydropantoate 2-reductase